MMLMSHDKSSVVSEPAESAFNDISSPVPIPESIVLSIDVSVILPVRREEVDSSLPQSLPVGVGVVGLVSDHSLWPRSGSTRSLLRDPDVPHDLLKEADLSRRGRRGMASQRNTLAIDHHQKLRSFPPLRLADFRAPFFAGMKVASTKASSQSRIPSWSSSDRKARHISSSTPVSCQSLRRRQQVEGWGYRSGRSFHLAPVLRIQRIPSKQARSSAGGRPPLGLGPRSGMNSLILSHCSSVSIGSRALTGSPPASVIVNIFLKYKCLIHFRLHALTRKFRFCNGL